MTCIVAVADEKTGEIVMGGDSLEVDAGRIFLSTEPKFFRKGDMLIGCAGSPRYVQILRYAWTAPEHPDGISDMDYLTRILVPSIWRALEASGFECMKDGQWVMGECETLIAYRGGLYTIDSYLSVTRQPEGYEAIGSGAKVALGALYAMYEDNEESVAYLVGIALAAAARYDQAVRPPFNLERLEPSHSSSPASGDSVK